VGKGVVADGSAEGSEDGLNYGASSGDVLVKDVCKGDVGEVGKFDDVDEVLFGEVHEGTFRKRGIAFGVLSIEVLLIVNKKMEKMFGF